MTALGAGDYIAFAGLLAAFVALPGTVIIVLMKGMRSDNATFRTQINGEIFTLEERMRTVEAEKVDKRDWIREQVSMAAKVDVVGREIASLNGKFDASLGIGAGIARTADSVRMLAQAMKDRGEDEDRA